jgi:hypothetical protein
MKHVSLGRTRRYRIFNNGFGSQNFCKTLGGLGLDACASDCGRLRLQKQVVLGESRKKGASTSRLFVFMHG